MTESKDSIRILIIEDELDLQVILNQVLSEYDGISYQISTSGEEAMKILNENDFDVVITDHYLPGEIQGIDLLEWLGVNRPAVKQILITGSIKPEVFEDAKRRGKLVKIYHKPIMFEEVISDVLELEGN